MQEVHLVLSCTNRKRSSELSSPRLGSVAPAPVAERAEQWAAVISESPHRYLVSSLYGGEYWQIGMKLAADIGSQFDGQVSVISAGLGLIGIDDEVPVYGATFTNGHPDSVAQDGAPPNFRRRWWNELATVEQLGFGGPRRLADIATPGADDGVIVCVGRDYLHAVVEDMLELSKQMMDPGRLVIFAAGKPVVGLEDHWVQVPGALRLVLGGSLASTSVHTARAFVHQATTAPLEVGNARRLVATLGAGGGDLPKFDRRRASDHEVVDWIVDHISAEPNSNKSLALRAFRDLGFACEQQRFGRLFSKAQDAAT